MPTPPFAPQGLEGPLIVSKPMRTRLQRFIRYPTAERRALSIALALLMMARLLLRFLTVPVVRRAVAWCAPAVAPVPPRLAELVTVAALQLPGVTTCLPRAIVLEGLLRASGRPAELRIGVASLPLVGRPDTHAWVELDGVSLDETAKGYTPLPVFGTGV